MGMTPPYLDPTCQEALYEVDGGAYNASSGLSELNPCLSDACDNGGVAARVASDDRSRVANHFYACSRSRRRICWNSISLKSVSTAHRFV